jgi:hypothetical protein
MGFIKQSLHFQDGILCQGIMPEAFFAPYILAQ